MSHWQLGDQETAGEWYDKALAWMDANASIWQNDLQLFAKEAAECLQTGDSGEIHLAP